MNWRRIFEGKKKNVDEVFEVIEVIQTINNRKLKHLHDCIDAICKSAKVPYTTPESFVTELEITILNRMQGEKADQLKKLLLKSFDEMEGGNK